MKINGDSLTYLSMATKYNFGKILSGEEKKILRKRKIAISSLADLSINKLMDVLGVSKERAHEIFGFDNGLGLALNAEGIAQFGVGVAATIYGNSAFNSASAAINLSGLVAKPLESIDKMLGNAPVFGTEPYIKLSSGVESFAQLYKESNTPGIYPSDLVKNAMLGIGSIITSETAMGTGDFPSLSGQFEMITGKFPKNWHEAVIGDSVLNTIRISNSLNTPLALSKSLSSLTAAYNAIPMSGDSIASSAFDIIGNKAISPIKFPSFGVVETPLNSIVNQSNYKRLGLADVGSSILNGYQSAAIVDARITSSISHAVSLSNQAEQTLSGFNWRDFGGQLNITAGLISSAKNVFFDYADGYSALLKSIDKKPNWVYDAPGIVEIPSLSFYSQSRVIEVASIGETTQLITDRDKEIEYIVVDAIDQLLPKLDGDLLKMWKGAAAALDGDNPDFIRHFITSLRELYTHVLNMLSPEAEFKAWNRNPDYLSNGRPTREGRLQYIIRNLGGSKTEFRKFMAFDVKSTLELIGIFQGGIHGINSSLTKAQLIAIKIKAGTILQAMLEIEFSINRAN